MVTVTRLNGKKFVINADLIRTIEANPDTTITLTTGDKYIVAESVEQVVASAVEYGQSLRKLLSPT